MIGILPSQAKEILIKVIEFVYSDIKIFTAVCFVLFIVAWAIMSEALNLDDKTWKAITFIFMVFLFFSLFVMIERKVIVFDFPSIWQNIKSIWG